MCSVCKISSTKKPSSSGGSFDFCSVAHRTPPLHPQRTTRHEVWWDLMTQPIKNNDLGLTFRATLGPPTTAATEKTRLGFAVSSSGRLHHKRVTAGFFIVETFSWNQSRFSPHRSTFPVGLHLCSSSLLLLRLSEQVQSKAAMNTSAVLQYGERGRELTELFTAGYRYILAAVPGLVSLAVRHSASS